MFVCQGRSLGNPSLSLGRGVHRGYAIECVETVRLRGGEIGAQEPPPTFYKVFAR